MSKRCYSVELDNDLDDFTAYKYMEATNMIDYVVLSPYPETQQGLNLLKEIKLPIAERIEEDTEIVFVGGSFTEVAKYLKDNKLKYLVANGGFVGSNIEKNPLDKFKNKEYVRTFNFNIDIKSTLEVLKSKNVEEIIMIGKNVCHSHHNTILGDWWKDDKILVDINKKYGVKDSKLQHDILAFTEGVKYINKEETKFDFIKTSPVNRGVKGKMTEWGSSVIVNPSFKRVVSAKFKEEM